MKNNFFTAKQVPIIWHLMGVATLLALLLPVTTQAANTLLNNKPLVDSTTSDVSPNLMFILDNSGSMAQNYTPDWANSSNPMLFSNPAYNTQYYNPAILYTPAVDYDGVSRASQTTWTSVNNNAFRVTDGQSDLVPKAKYYAFIPGEFCTSQGLTDCTTTNVATGAYIFPAPMRWCNTSLAALAASPAVGACRAVRAGSFTNLRRPSSTSTITFASGTSTAITSIKVNGLEIMFGPTASTTNTTTMATNVRNQINACTNTSIGSCGTIGFSATASGSAVTIVSAFGSASTSPVVTISPTSGGITETHTVFATRTPGSAVFVNIVTPTSTTYPLPGKTAAGTDRTDCTVGSPCTYAQEMTNYANWWTYYQTRMQGMKSSASLAFKGIDSRYRVGFITIANQSQAGNYLPIASFASGAGNQKQNWYNTFFAIIPNTSTPLRSALSIVGRIYANKSVGFTSPDPVQYACQKNFALLTTDGYWNTDINSDVKDVNGSPIGNLDSDVNSRPLYEGATASSATLADTAKYYYDTDLRTSALSNCTGVLGQNVCGEAASEVNIVKQNMTTFTLGLGVDGTLQYSTDYKTQTTGDFADIKAGTNNWSVPVANTESAVDDLWHAAVNGNGTYFSARDPKQLTTSLKKALSDIQSHVGAGSAASASALQPTTGDNFNYIASYTTAKWIGNLEARTVNLTTLQTSEDALWCVENIASQTCSTGFIASAEIVSGSSVFYCKATGLTATACTNAGGFVAGTDCKIEIASSCLGTMPNKVGATADTRNIKFNSSGSLTDLTFGNLSATQQTYFGASALSSKLAQWNDLTTGTGSQQAMAVGNGIVNYLRGQKGLEDNGGNPAASRIFRNREATMGDITESQPVFIAKPFFNYVDAGYASFVTAQANRKGMIYVGANDGMLHAFYAKDQVAVTPPAVCVVGGGTYCGGEEAWAFVPTPVISKMAKLADRDYAVNHVNFVNGDPQIADICTANCTVAATATWKTILVGGLSGGGRGYYALDVTNPTAPVMLWEYTAQDQSNLGYSFGRPVITKLDSSAANGANANKWVVLLTSSYDNGSFDADGATTNSPTGDGKGYLYVLDASTGSQLKAFSTGVGTATTPSGLAYIAAYADDGYKNNLATYTYGGDLLGNLWRFDINAASGTAPFQMATLVGPAGLAQPITTIPQLGLINKRRVIYVGTGKYLEAADLGNTDVQTIYAIKDYNLTTGAELGNPRSNLVAQTLTTIGDSRKLTTTQSVDFNTGLGWYIDLPAGERMNIDPTLINGVLLAPTIVPTSTSCSPGGTGWFNYFNYATGGAPTNAGGYVSELLSAPAVGYNLVYDSAGKPTVSVIVSNNPNSIQTKRQPVPADSNTRNNVLDSNSNGTYGKRSIWRELTQ